MSGSRTKRLRRLHAQNPHCHWCHRATVLGSFNAKGGPAGNCATLDHIYSRRTAARAAGRGETVLSCYSCNTARNDIEQKSRSADERRQAQAARMLADARRRMVHDPFPDAGPYRLGDGPGIDGLNIEVLARAKRALSDVGPPDPAAVAVPSGKHVSDLQQE